MSALWVKICGITNRDDALAAVDAGAAAVGFNFFQHSRRYVGSATAAEIARALPRDVWRVGVFVDAARDTVQRIAATVGLTALQFHGEEGIEFCRGWDCVVIKAVRVRAAGWAMHAQAFDAEYILADSYVEGHFGGTGTAIDGPLLVGGIAPSRLIVAGGLTPANVSAVIRAVRPFGVDVATGVEHAPGKKDWSLMRRFVANAHAA